jgi:hypothetical protein
VELKPAYYRQAVKNLAAAAESRPAAEEIPLFDLAALEGDGGGFFAESDAELDPMSPAPGGPAAR